MGVKITDVARHAGVGAGTVSRVLNGGKNVSVRTRSRVLASINELRYVPNLVARSLAANRTGVVAALVPSLGYTQHAEVAQGLMECLREHGITLVIGHCGYDLDTEAAIVEAFLARRPDAFYLTGTDHAPATRKLLRASGVPVIEGSNLTANPIDCVVGYSNFEAMRQLTHRIARAGKRRLMHVSTANEPNDRIRDRQRGYEAACTELGISTRSQLITRPNTLDGGADALRVALRQEVGTLLCATDVLAVGALLECQRLRVSVPKSIGISGFDDLPIAASMVPPLTTVRIRRHEMGRRVAEVLLMRLAGKRIKSRTVDIGFDIIERGTTQRN